MKLTICVDMDDTIEDLLPAWVNYLNKKHDLHIELKDINCWDMGANFPMLTHDEIFEPLYQQSFWGTVEPKADAMKYLEKLYKDGHEIFICTHSHYATIAAKYSDIIKKYFPFIDWNHVIVMHRKQMIKCDVMVDDGPHNLENGEYVRILFTAAHNRSYPAAKNAMIRVKDWSQIYSIISLLAKNGIKM